eukprot:scaffold12338_cov119-Isochrysis_galbana.AAC.2
MPTTHTRDTHPTSKERQKGARWGGTLLYIHPHRRLTGDAWREHLCLCPNVAVGMCMGAQQIAGSPNWEGTGKVFCLREDLRQELRRFQGRAPAWLLGAW